MLISCSETFTDYRMQEIRPVELTRGFSSFRFIPGRDTEVVALKTQELEGKYSEVMEILYKRYARGEISREEYTQIKEGISRQEE